MSGVVEVDKYGDRDHWYPIVDAGILAGRNYDAFGFLFGVRNYANFDPVAAKRGLPDNPSSKVKNRVKHTFSFQGETIEVENWEEGKPDLDSIPDLHSFSYLTAKEIEEIDWSQESEDLDSRTHFYDKDGNLRSKAAGFNIPTKGRTDKEKLHEGEEIEVEIQEDEEFMPFEGGDKMILKKEKVKAEDVLNDEWEALLDIISRLGETYGKENVRLVVWFSG